jgi:hypothetical protein
VCGTGFWRRGEDVVTGGIACLDEGAVDERLVMGCGPPSSWRKFQGTLKRGSSPSHVRPLPPQTPGHYASSLLNFTPQRLRLRIKEGTHPTSPPCSSAVRALDIGCLALYSTYCRCRWRCSAERACNRPLGA